MMKLVLVSVIFIVISSGGCYVFPDGLEDRNSADELQPHTDDQHPKDENEIVTLDDEDQLWENREAVKGRESRGGNTDKKILKLVKEVLKNQYNMTAILYSLMSVNYGQDSKLAGLSSAISNISATLDSLTGGCPTGFFRCIPSNQCFKLFHDVTRNFTEASQKCNENGLTLAQPVYPVSVRSYIVATYGSKYCWIGARGNNTTVVWLRGGQALSNQEKAYYYNTIQPASNYGTLMLSAETYETRGPNKPYYSYSLRYRQYTLCELTVE